MSEADHPLLVISDRVLTGTSYVLHEKYSEAKRWRRRSLYIENIDGNETRYRLSAKALSGPFSDFSAGRGLTQIDTLSILVATDTHTSAWAVLKRVSEIRELSLHGKKVWQETGKTDVTQEQCHAPRDRAEKGSLPPSLRSRVPIPSSPIFHGWMEAKGANMPRLGKNGHPPKKVFFSIFKRPEKVKKSERKFATDDTLLWEKSKGQEWQKCKIKFRSPYFSELSHRRHTSKYIELALDGGMCIE